MGGLRFADRFMHGTPDETVIIFSLVVGFVSAIMAIALRKITLGAAGFLVGGYLLMMLFSATGQEHQFAVAVGNGGRNWPPGWRFLSGGCSAPS